MSGSPASQAPLDPPPSWEDVTDAWTRWARDPELDDDVWGCHLEAFLALLPPPAR